MKIIRDELQNLISGKSPDSQRNVIQAIRSFFEGHESSGSEIKAIQFSRENEQKELKKYIEANNLWYTKKLNLEDKIREGAEQSVYKASGNTVIKLNDPIFYIS